MYSKYHQSPSNDWLNQRLILTLIALLRLYTWYYLPYLWWRAILWPIIKWHMYRSLIIFIHTFCFGIFAGYDASIKNCFYPKKSRSAGRKVRTITPNNVEHFIERPQAVSGSADFTWLTALHTNKVVSNSQMMDAQLINGRGKVETQFAEAVIKHVEEKRNRLEVLGIQLPQLPPMVCFGTSYLNSSWALQARHLGSRMLPDPIVVSEFLHFGQSKINALKPAFSKFLLKNPPNMDDYLAHLPDTKKRVAYQTAYNDLLTYQRFDKKFVIEMKAEECLQGQKLLGPASTVRPRNIFNPPT